MSTPRLKPKPADASHYALLEVPETADLQTIKNSYKRLSRIWHPDKSKHPEAKQEFQRIVAAYEILSNKEQRKKYDDDRRFSRGVSHERQFKENEPTNGPPRFYSSWRPEQADVKAEHFPMKEPKTLEELAYCIQTLGLLVNADAALLAHASEFKEAHLVFKAQDERDAIENAFKTLLHITPVRSEVRDDDGHTFYGFKASSIPIVMNEETAPELNSKAMPKSSSSPPR